MHSNIVGGGIYLLPWSFKKKTEEEFEIFCARCTRSYDLWETDAAHFLRLHLN